MTEDLGQVRREMWVTEDSGQVRREMWVTEDLGQVGREMWVTEDSGQVRREMWVTEDLGQVRREILVLKELLGKFGRLRGWGDSDKVGNEICARVGLHCDDFHDVDLGTPTAARRQPQQWRHPRRRTVRT